MRQIGQFIPGKARNSSKGSRVMTTNTIRFARLTGVAIMALTLGACVASGPEANLQVAASAQATEVERASDVQLAAAARAGGDYATAIRMLRRHVAADPMVVASYIELGETLHEAGAFDEAVEVFEHAKGMSFKNVAALTGLGRAQLALRRAAEAVNHFDIALSVSPDDLLAINGRGVGLDMLGRHDEAQHAYRTALALRPTNYLVENNLAISLLLSEHFNEAIEILERLSFTPRATSQMRQNLALAYGLRGDTETASQIAALDLDAEMVENNMAYYAVIRGHSQPKLRTAPLVVR